MRNDLFCAFFFESSDILEDNFQNAPQNGRVRTKCHWLFMVASFKNLKEQFPKTHLDFVSSLHVAQDSHFCLTTI